MTWPLSTGGEQQVCAIVFQGNSEFEILCGTSSFKKNCKPLHLQ
jgi:hypothetical protein